MSIEPATNDTGEFAAARLSPLISEIWQELLACPEPEPGQHFFTELGGSSVLAFQVTVRLRQRLDRHVPLKLLFSKPSLAGYSGAVADHLAATAARN